MAESRQKKDTVCFLHLFPRRSRIRSGVWRNFIWVGIGPSMIDSCHSDVPSGYKVFRCLYRRHRAPQAHQYRCPGLSLDGAPLALRPPFPSPPSRNPIPNHPSPAATPPCVIPNDPPSRTSNSGYSVFLLAQCGRRHRLQGPRQCNADGLL